MQLRRHLLKSISNYKLHTMRDLLVRKLFNGRYQFSRYYCHVQHLTNSKF